MTSVHLTSAVPSGGAKTALPEHTRGPWTLTHIHGSNFAVQAFELRGAFGDALNVYPIFNQRAAEIGNGIAYLRPADARLIAAAPDLLSALLALVELGTDSPEHRAAEAAIAKALWSRQ